MAVRFLFSGFFGLKCDGISVAKGCWILGPRNSHDKTFPAGIMAGSSVFICDTLAFSMAGGFAPGDLS